MHLLVSAVGLLPGSILAVDLGTAGVVGYEALIAGERDRTTAEFVLWAIGGVVAAGGIGYGALKAKGRWKLPPMIVRNILGTSIRNDPCVPELALIKLNRCNYLTCHKKNLTAGSKIAILLLCICRGPGPTARVAVLQVALRAAPGAAAPRGWEGDA